MLFPNINPIAIELGYISIRWYGISYVIGVLLGVYILKKIEKKYTVANLISSAYENLLTYIIIGITIGGRLGYILFYCPNVILDDFWEIFKIWHGGMSFHGGLLGVMASIWLFSLKNGKFISTMDLIACVVPIGLFFGRIANFINAELYGKKTNVSWGVIFPNTDYQPRHPSQLYEAAFEGIMLFCIMLIALRIRQNFLNNKTLDSKKSKNMEGFLSGVFLTFYSLFRIIIEIFREPDQHIGYIFNLLSLGQILSIPMLVMGIYLIFKRVATKN
ncbi:prolipoprotein diacylglyceryl transferase [Candidatus Aquarickettsia rohweri]|uniref:Phosphatidylglycerol--prolipoprotein diacylglyceryl transferase n=1 Tax=Candidatus Aquarickettsia rohweri TaxID=2602574 RepID=A0A3R9ZBI7_9RICK|nr:prolipoprotein diacylglyceryl transferase [Candidatus Aquarickettsia rohweri]RST70033.1 prolipoprotein diacylglyceryl transferase [Candidatus Aquarickettsia rohweri]